MPTHLRRLSVSFVAAILLVAVSGWGIVRWQKAIDEISVASLGPLVEAQGILSQIEEKNDGLDIRLQGDTRPFRCIGSYPEKFHLGSGILYTLKPGENVTITVPEKELEELPDRKRWKWAEFVGLRTDEKTWLTPQSHVDWDRENQTTGVRLLWIVFGAACLWLLTLCFPGFREPCTDLLSRLFRFWITNKWSTAAVILLLMIIPTSYDCWLVWRMRDAPLVSGSVVEREKFKKYFLIPWHRMKIQPEDSSTLINAAPRLNVPDEVKFRWDGKAEQIYLPQGDENPWLNLVFVTVLGLISAGLYFLMRSVLKE